MAIAEGTRVVRGACPLDCPDACAWEVEVDAAGTAVGLRGAREHPFTRGALCGKVNRYLDLLHGDDRITTPLRRVGAKGEGRFEPIGWDEAIELAAAGITAAIERHGPESVLPYYFAGTMGLVQGWTVGPRVFGALGASRLRTTICTAAATAGLRANFGASVGMDPEDIRHAQLVILWGGNPLSTNVHQWRFVLDARANGAHVVCIDPLRSATAERSDEHIAPLPGTDGALALGLMRAVVDAGAADREWLEAYSVGWPQLEERLAEWPLERAAETCGLPLEVVRGLGERLVATRPTAIRVGLGLQRHGGAGAAIRAITAIPAVTGDWRHLGGGQLCMTAGHFPLAEDDAVRPEGLEFPPARAINMSRIAEALVDLDDPPVAALVVWGTNPAASAPDQRRVREGLAREDLFTVVLEHRLTDTADYADLVLPATMQPEHLDLMGSYGHLYVTLNTPATRPPGDCLPNSEIFRRLAAALGLDHPRMRDSDEEVVRQLLDTPEARAHGATYEALQRDGWVRIGFPPGTAPFAEGGFPNPTGKVQLLNEALAKRGRDGLVGYVPPHEVADPELAARYPLALLVPASRFFLNSTFASLPWHRDRNGPPLLHLHPDDAAARGLSGGESVRIFNDRGEFTAEVAVSQLARPGVCCTFKTPWPKLLGEGRYNANATSPERDADMAGAPTFHDNRVEVALAG